MLAKSSCLPSRYLGSRFSNLLRLTPNDFPCRYEQPGLAAKRLILTGLFVRSLYSILASIAGYTARKLYSIFNKFASFHWLPAVREVVISVLRNSNVELWHQWCNTEKMLNALESWYRCKRKQIGRYIGRLSAIELRERKEFFVSIYWKKDELGKSE